MPHREQIADYIATENARVPLCPGVKKTFYP